MQARTHRGASWSQCAKQLASRALAVLVGCVCLGSSGGGCAERPEDGPDKQCTVSRESCEQEGRCWRIQTKGQTKVGFGLDPDTSKIDADGELNGECNIECLSCADISADGGTPADSGAPQADTLEAAIQRLATAFCDRDFGCSPVWMEIKAATKEGCVREVVRWTRWEAGLPGSGVSVGSLEECVSEIVRHGCAAKTYTCVYGTHADGAACASGTQCRSGWCTGDPATCGYCVPERDRTGPCGTDSDCFFESHCSQEGHCESDFLAGHPCARDAECDAYLSCIGGACQANNRQLGALCGPTIGFCDQRNAQLACGAEKCQFASFADPGDECPSFGWCRGGGGCLDNVCQAGPGPGTSCEEDSDCGWLAFCKDGTCRIPATDPCAAD